MKKFLIPLFLILVIIVWWYTYASEIKNLLTNWIESEEITINSWEAIVFSFSKQIEEITFSKDSWFTIRTLEWGKWIDLSNSVSDYVPLKGYLVRNISDWSLVINARYKTISTIEDSIFQRSLKAWWNLVWIAYKDDNDWFVSVSNWLWESLPYSQVLDFTWNGFKNNLSWTYSNEVQILNKGHNVNNSLYQIKAKSDLANYNLLEKFAYAIFINTDSEIAWSQKLTSTWSTGTWSNDDWSSDAIINNTSFWDVNKILWSQDIEVLHLQITSSWSDEINIKKIKLKIMVVWNNATSQDISEIKLVDWNNNLISSVSWSSIDVNWNVEIVLNNNEIQIWWNITKNYKILVSITNNVNLISKQIITQFTSIEAIDTDLDSVNYSINNQIGIIINVIEKWVLSLTEDQNNNDNEYEKNILAWDSINVFSVDAQATNENINVWNVTFTVNKDLRKAVINASLYKWWELIATNINTDITSSTISFNNLENLIISNEEVELILKLNTANIWFEKVWETIIDAKVTNVSLTDNEWITTNQTVDDVNVNVDWTLFSIVPGIIWVNSNLINPASPQFSITAYTDNNTKVDSSSKPDINIKSISFSLLWTSDNNNSIVYELIKTNDNSDILTWTKNWDILTFDLSSFNNSDNATISDWVNKGYEINITWTDVDEDIVSLKLLKGGIIYDVDTTTNIKSKLNNDIDLGSTFY